MNKCFSFQEFNDTLSRFKIEILGLYIHIYSWNNKKEMIRLEICIVYWETKNA